MERLGLNGRADPKVRIYDRRALKAHYRRTPVRLSLPEKFLDCWLTRRRKRKMPLGASRTSWSPRCRIDGRSPISPSGSVSMADDLVQETLLRAWSKSDEFQWGPACAPVCSPSCAKIDYSDDRKRAARFRTATAWSSRGSSLGDQESDLDLEDFARPSPGPDGAARVLDPRRGERLSLRGGRDDLRRRDRHDQELPQPRARSKLVELCAGDSASSRS